MKNLKPLFLITILTLLILSSCFLQKRHYMQGYHITWKNSKHKARSVEMVNSAKNSIIKKESLEQLPVTLVSPDSAELASVSNDKIIDLPVKRPKLITGESSLTPTSVEIRVDNSFKNNTQKPDEDKKKSGPGPIPGILMMLLGLLLFGLGYIFYTNLGVFIGTFFFLIFGIGGAIFFIIGIIMLFVR